MASLDQIRIDLEGIAHVLADNRVKVPTFQRSYAWEQGSMPFRVERNDLISSWQERTDGRADG